MKKTYEEYGGVVVDMEERELFPTFLCDDEHRVEEVENLGEVKHVQDKRDWRIFEIEGIARKQCISCSISSYSSFDAHVRA